MKYLLDIDDKINEAHKLTSKYREFNRTATIDSCEQEFDELIDIYLSSSLSQFNDIGRTLCNWKDEIINSFITIEDSLTIPKKKDEDIVPRRLSNGPIEGINNE